jgi:hypothetical protein
MISWNMAAWRDDLLRVNGFDQRYRGWGCEDDDIGRRLRASGVRLVTVLGYTHAYHQWHPPHATTPRRWSDGLNVEYFQRPVKLTRCLDGIVPRRIEDLSVRCTAGPVHAELARQTTAHFQGSPAPLEIELLFWPAATGFQHRADHRILLATERRSVPGSVARHAHATIALGDKPHTRSVIESLHRILHGQAVDVPADAVSSAA